MSDQPARPDAAAGGAASDRPDRTIDRAAPDIELSFDDASAQPILAAFAALEHDPAPAPEAAGSDSAVVAAEPVFDAADAVVRSADVTAASVAAGETATRAPETSASDAAAAATHGPRAPAASASATQAVARASSPAVVPGADPAARSDPAAPESAAPAAAPVPDVVVVPELHVAAHVEVASPDVAAPAAEATLPGAHRGGFTRPPTAPVEITEERLELVSVTGAVLTPPPMLRPANFAAIGLGFAVVGLIASLVVGVAFPIGVTAVALGILSLRRPFESRQIAVWTIVLGAVSVVYSAGWLVWAAYRAGWVG
ncbi:hypothetical protein [Microbacterium sp. 18062]|uniref:hypothetical protein n=1 Tax=Microbacterium sp. 18062 TaxID=2681410 RepID=UPI00190F3196|nr:hypothetical protein [Microbacterium sp. 18062]